MKRRAHVIVAWFAIAALAGRSSAFGESITGRVLDSNGAPVAGVRVLAAESAVGTVFYSTPENSFATSPSQADKALGTEGKLSQSAKTDKQGRFELGELRDARFSVLAVDAKRGLAARYDVAAGAKDVEIALEPGAWLEGSLDGFAFDPQRHVLELKPRALRGNVSWLPKVEHLEGGRFRVGPLPVLDGWNLTLTDWVRERAYRATLLTVPIDVAAGERVELPIEWTKGHALAGVVRDSRGEPSPAVSVVARSKTAPFTERGAVTDEAGRYAIQGLSEGAWTLEARRWTMRPTAGCGVGPKDLFVAREVAVPLADPTLADLAARPVASLAVGDAAPAFDVATLDGRTLSLASLRGKVVVVDFWATWCGMCRADFPKLRETYATLGGGRDLEIVGVSIDEDRDAARRVTERLKLVWPQTALGPVETNQLAQLFNVASTPTCFVLDREGRIAGINLFGDDLRAKLRELVRGSD